MKRTEILICGLGGQGVIFAGELLGRAAVLSGLEAAESSSYGSESRGSACHSSVVISDNLIAYPMVSHPDVLIALSQTGYGKFAGKVKPGGQIFFDQQMVERTPLPGVAQIGIPATKAAAELGRKSVANVVLLAASAYMSGVAEESSLLGAVIDQSPEPFRELNSKAISLGIELAHHGL